MDRLNDLAVTLREAQAADLADRIDQTELHALLPDVRDAIERCMQPPAIGEPSDSPILVPIRASGSSSPLFFLTFSETGIPGVRAIAEILGTRRPLYGGAVNHAIAAQPEIEAIQDLAEVFLEEIRKARPQGPYVLAGNSVGGLVAYELASRLLERGEDVPLLLLVDTVALNSLPASSRVRMARKRVRAALLRHLPDPVRSNLRRTRARISRRSFPPVVHRSPNDPGERPLRLRSPRYGRGEQALLNIVGRYRPRPYPGRIALLRTKMTSLLFEDSELGWGRLARAGFDIEEVSGFHGGLMRQPYVAALGETLAKQLDQAGV
jgi:thioesterase domain-containing protein